MYKLEFGGFSAMTLNGISSIFTTMPLLCQTFRQHFLNIPCYLYTKTYMEVIVGAMFAPKKKS